MKIKSRLLSQSAIIFAMRLMGAGLIVLAQAGMARLWGGEILGEYLLVMAVINLIAMGMPLGFQTVGTYFAAEYRAAGQGKLLWRFLLQSYAHVALVGASLLLVGMVFAEQFFGEASTSVEPNAAWQFLSELAPFWMQGSLIAVAIAVIFVNGSVLVGLKRPYAGFFADGFFRPLLVIAAFGLAAVWAMPEQRLDMMFWIFAAGYSIVAAVHSMSVVKNIKGLPAAKDGAEKQTSRWWRFALPWVLIDLATLYFFDIDLILLSGMMDRETLAVFGVCTRMFSLMAFGITAVYAVSLPDMFEAASDSNKDEFHKKLGEANFVAVGLSVVLFAGILLVGPFVLMIFGAAFMAGTIPLAILCLALIVRSAFGPAALVLSINDRPWASIPAIGAGMVVLVVANYVMVPMWGLMGAAFAALTAFSIWAALMWWTAYAATGMDVSILPRLCAMLGNKQEPSVAPASKH